VQDTASAAASTPRRCNAPPSGVESGVGHCCWNKPVGRHHHDSGDPVGMDLRSESGCIQLGAHAVTPLHLLLFLPFIDLGVHPFHTRRLPLSRQQIEHLSHHPRHLIRNVWQWEWHALLVWGLMAAIAMPLLAMYIRRALVLLMRRHRTLLRSRPALH